MIKEYLTPSNTLNFIEKYLSPIFFLMIIFFSFGVYYSFFNSPADYQQGEYVRIMYVHVPSAWLSLGIYSLMAVSSFIFLVWHNPMFDLISKSSASIGTLFCLITLVTGSFWGKPIWGTWWVWDARLTSMLILFFFYAGYLALVKISNQLKNNKAPAALAIVGFINVPIVKFSVNLWNSLHQPASVFRLGGPSIHSSMLKPLMIMFFSFALFYLVNLMLILKKNILISKNKRDMIRKLSS